MKKKKRKNLFLPPLALTDTAPSAQHDMGQFIGSQPPPFVAPSSGGAWWPPQEFGDGAGGLLPNPGASMFAFQFNGAEHGKNFVTLPRGLSARLPRTFTLEAHVWLPALANRAASEALPILSRFNVRLQTGPKNLDSHNDFGFEVLGATGELRFWMGGGHAVDYGFDVRSREPLPTGQWVHVAVSVLSSESRNPFFAMLFVDGKEVAAQNWKTGAERVFQSNEAIALGYRQRGAAAFYFEGVVDEVRLWGVARKANEIAAQADVPLAGDEDGLVALYRLDDFGDRVVHDAGAHALHGYTLKPLWTLGGAKTLLRRETGVQGFAVDIVLGAVDLVPTAPDGFEFMLDCVPAHGCLFAPDDPKMQCAAATDVGARIYPAGALHYMADKDYLGADKICYRARRIGERTFSPATDVLITVVEAPDTGCLTRFDECGVCGGDGMSCKIGGCDGKGGKFDACMVCGGDGSTCTCAVYKSYKLDEMDCILFDHAINRTLVRLEHSMHVLADTLKALSTYDAEDKVARLDLLLQIEHLCGIKDCVRHYTDEVSLFIDYSNEYLKTALLKQCDEKPKLSTYFERKRL